METKTFDYSLYRRLIRVFPLLMALGVTLIVACALIMALFDTYTSYTLFKHVTVGRPGGETVGVIFTVFLFWNLAIVNHLLTPAVCIRGQEFQLYTPFYRSRWLTWDKIRDVNEHFMSTQRHRMITIGVDDVTRYFSVIGFAQLHGGSAFLVDSHLNGFGEFLKILNENRPDLLSMELRNQIELHVHS